VEAHLSNDADGFEDINDVIQSADLGLNQSRVISMDEYLGGLLKRDWSI
jgi:hypothetical protein